MALLNFLENVAKGIVSPVAGFTSDVSNELYNQGVAPVLGLPHQVNPEQSINPIAGKVAQFGGATGTLRNTLGNAAGTALLGVGGGELAGAEGGIGARVALGAKTGAKVGAGFGVASDVANAQNVTPENLTMSFLEGGAGGATLGAVGGAVGGVISDVKAARLAKIDNQTKIQKELTPDVGPVVARDVAPAVAQTNDPNIVKNVVANDVNKKAPVPAPVAGADITAPSVSEPVNAGQGSEQTANAPSAQTNLADKQRAYLETVQNAKTSTPELIQGAKELQQTYQQKSNTELMSKAQQTVEKDYSGSLSQILTKDKLSDNDVAVGQEIMRRAQNEGRIDEAVNVADALDTKLREAGRTIQAASLWGKLSPEGVLRLATRKVNEARDSGFAKPQEEQNTATELQNTIEGTQPINQKAVSNTIQKLANEQQALPLEGVDTRSGAVENTGQKLATNVARAASPQVKSKADVLVQELTKKVKQEYLNPQVSVKRPPLDILKETFGRNDEANEAYPYAQQILRDKYANVPQMMDALDKFFGSDVGMPAANTTINSAIKDQLAQNGNRISQTIYKSWNEQGQTVESTANALVKEGFDKDSANTLAQEVTKRLNQQITDSKQKALENMSKSLPEKRQSTFLDKVNKLSNLGALDKQDYLQLAQAKLGTPHLDPMTATKLSGMSQKLQDMPEGADRDFLSNQIYSELAKLTPNTTSEKIFGLWRGGLLTGTHILPKVAESHVAHALGETASQTVGAGIDKFISNFGFSSGERALTVTSKGIGGGLKTASTKVGNLFKTGVDSGIGQSNGGEFARTFQYGDSMPGKFLSAYVNGVGRVHGAVYKFFAEPKYANTIYEQAKLKAMNQGLKGKEADNFIANLVHSPTQEIKDIAEQTAKEFSFQQETALGNIASSIQEKGGPLGKALAPFTRIPSAIATDVFNYAPTGAVKTIYNGIRAARTGDGWTTADQRAFSMGLGRSITGAAAIVPGIMLYNRGMMTLGYPSDPKEQALWQDEGKTPNSVLVNGKWESLGSLGPVGSVLSIGGHMADSLLQGKDIGTAMVNGLAGGAQSIQEQSYLQGVNQASTALSDPNKASSVAKNYAGSIVPSGLANVAQGTDSLQRDTNGNNIPQSALNAVKNRIPGLREQLNPATDSFGNDLGNNKAGGKFNLGLADPGYGSTNATPGPLLGELRRLQNAGFGEMPPAIAKKYNFGTSKQPDTVQLTRDQQEGLKGMIGQLSQYYWSQAIQNPNYQQADDPTRQAILKQVQSSATQEGALMFEQQEHIGRFSPNLQQEMQKSRQKRVNVI